ncbi:MAG: nucleotide exchange factor GrpE [Deltaproteobacteria bacterium]|nr:nucleotide exchange factor GrpE [Deltaproteobacteria bacterium]
MTHTPKTKVDELKKMLDGKKKEESPPEPEAIDEKLHAAEEESKQNRDKLLRVMADFDNYKKRVSKEHEERSKYSHESLIRELIPVMDDFDRVLEHLPTDATPETKGMIEGVDLTHRHFMSALKKLNLKEVETEGKMFDPHFHEALTQVESDEHNEGEIVTCHRKGYLLHDRLLRPALVTIAKGKTH